MSVENVRVNAESRLIELAQQNPDGISNEDLKQNMPQVSLQDLTEIINKLLKSGTLELFTSRGELLYKYKDPSQKTAGKGSDIEAKLVYKIIEEAGNKGIWIRDIRFKSNLNMTQLNKILKNFETKSIIKAVKSVAASKKKVYMLFDLEPDSSVTGGAWYQDQDFESEFVDVLSQQCHRYLVHRLEDAVKQEKMEDEDWLGARNFCRMRCMDSVSLETPQENEWIKKKIESENIIEIWTSGRICDFKGCDREDLLPLEINGWFWSATFQKLPPTTDTNANDWSPTGGKGVQQPDNREFNLNGKTENCIAVLNNKYNDGVRWHDEVCSRRRPFVCEDSEELLRYIRYIRPELNIM